MFDAWSPSLTLLCMAAARNLVRLKRFRKFYLLVVTYIYFTRIIVYLLNATLPFEMVRHRSMCKAFFICYVVLMLMCFCSSHGRCGLALYSVNSPLSYSTACLGIYSDLKLTILIWSWLKMMTTTWREWRQTVPMLAAISAALRALRKRKRGL